MDQRYESHYDRLSEAVLRRFNRRMHEIMEAAREDIVATLREERIVFE